MFSLPAIKEHVIGKLIKGLPSSLTYHNVAHTLDVVEQVCEIAQNEGIRNDEELMLLQVGALYHDVGFLNIYLGHEEKGCLIATDELDRFGFTENQIEIVCGMIRATKVPQQPKTHLEQIICDSDLDYLGRDDFFKLGEGLYKEYLRQKFVTNETEWNTLQVRFLESHDYFTRSSRERRQAAKQMNLQKVKEKLV